MDVMKHGSAQWHVYLNGALCGLVRRVYARWGKPAGWHAIGRVCMGCNTYVPDSV